LSARDENVIANNDASIVVFVVYFMFRLPNQI
jgi:hypothetical protein